MSEDEMIQIATVVVLGVGAQWLASRIRLPSILLLLLFGFLAGPVLGILDPNLLFGDLLFPLVSVSVGLILYEGGLTLKLSELDRTGGVVGALCSLGALVTWFISAVSARLIFNCDVGVAALLGAVLVVTGPTVVGPLLRYIRPAGPVGPVLKWEGIVIDPVGATLAVLVFEFISSSGPQAGALGVAFALAATIFVGGGLGILAGFALAFMLKRYWIPDFLQNAVSLMVVVAVFALANLVQHEAGLLAATVMGITLANQKLADVRHIVEFKENLRVLLISSLFVLLAARLNLNDLSQVGWGGVAFLLILVLVARPLAVLVSTLRSHLTTRERAFVAWMAPRGIVAAAVASLLALRLESPHAHLLVPIAFLTIIGTVAIYGLTAPLVAHRLGVADPDPQGVLLIGAQPWARAFAGVLSSKGIRVLLVDSNRQHVAAARMQGLPTYTGSILADYALDEINLGGIGRLLAVTPNDWVNALAAQRFARILGSANCFQLPPGREPHDRQMQHKHLHGRWLFGSGCSYAELSRRFAAGDVVKATRLTDTFSFDAFQKLYTTEAIVLCVITESGRLRIATAEMAKPPAPGQTVISLVTDVDSEKKASPKAAEPEK